MRMIMICTVLAAAAASSGCCTVPGCSGGGCADGAACASPSPLWGNYCGTGGCQPHRANLLDVLFGGGNATGTCATGTCADGACLAGTSMNGVVGDSGYGMYGANGGLPGMPGGLVGCAGNACDGRCGGQCAIAATRAGAMAQQAAGKAVRVTGAAVRHVAQTPQRFQDRCANGCRGLAPGPTEGAVAYPYYTTRGPRDFLMANPPNLGP